MIQMSAGAAHDMIWPVGVLGLRSAVCVSCDAAGFRCREMRPIPLLHHNWPVSGARDWGGFSRHGHRLSNLFRIVIGTYYI